jgi:hypothetical protein
MRLGRLPRITVRGQTPACSPVIVGYAALPRRPLRMVLLGHARVVREFRERPQLEGRVAREIAPQPSEVGGAVDDQDSLVGRIHKPDHIGVDQ